MEEAKKKSKSKVKKKKKSQIKGGADVPSELGGVWLQNDGKVTERNYKGGEKERSKL